MTDTSMLELFKMEVEQQSDALNNSLLVLDTNPSSAEDLEVAMRASHSLKGAAKLLDIQPVVGLAHLMEDCFVAAQESRITLTSNDVDWLLKSMDLISLIATLDVDANTWLAQNQAQYDALITALEGVLAGKQSASEIGEISIVESPVEAVVTSEPEPEPEPESPAEVSSVMQDPVMMELFKLESEEQGKVLNEGLLSLEQDPTSAERLEPLMRAAHSIKGAAKLVGLEQVVALAHLIEDVFVAAQEGSLSLTSDHIDVLLSSIDVLAEVASDLDNQWLKHNQSQYNNLLSSLKTVLSGGVVESVAVELDSSPNDEVEPAGKQVDQPVKSDKPVVTAKRKNVEVAKKDRVLRVSAEQINRLMGLAGESLVESRWLYHYAGSLQRLKRQQTELVGVIDNLREELDGYKLNSELNMMVRNAQSQASYCREIMADRLNELESYDRRASNLSSRLHREVVQSRMRPFGDGVHGFPRMVRDISKSLDKETQFVIEGEATLVDRDILDRIEAPLNHLIRNAIDHGIESAEQRALTDKPAKATIRLSAHHHSGMLSIMVQDDGRGVELESLRKKIVAKGLVDEGMSETLSEIELMEFLFLPGFSTKDQVSEISGRGVGLDVVHDVVQEMRGSVRATSVFGKGTKFHMQLPLTLSVIPALLVEIADEPYAFPLARIDKIIQVDNDIIEEAEGNQFISIDGKNIGLVSAGQILENKTSSEFADRLSIVVLNDRMNYYGMVVDKFLGERELVVQVMPEVLGKVQDIGSAALMEDGSPVLIVDVDDLFNSIEKALKLVRLGKVSAVEYEDTFNGKRVLVVDDSITVREVERKLLEGSGYTVDVAVDGIDGLNVLRSRQYDLLITDVDMPRMNGIELTKTVRQDPSLRSIPVMMVSYKDREEDRVRGMDAGADYYLTKGSFHDEGLRQAVIDLIGEVEG